MNEYGSSAGIARNASESEYPGLWRGLVGLWCPSAGIQGRRLIDFARGTKTIFVDSTTSALWVPGRNGHALSFSGGGYVDATALFAFGTGDFTISVWVKTSAATGNLLTEVDGTTGYWSLIFYNSSFIFQNSNTSANLYSVSATSILDNRWHQITVCRRGTSHSVYFDARSQAAPVTDTNDYNRTSTMRMGSGYYGAFTGLIDDIRIYKRALSASEIMQSFKGASPLVPLNRPYFNSPTAPPPAGNTTNFFRFFR
jgi:hypothetical protein